ncbi:hypothetical protein AVEN_145303-1, partial [Araneus ventricosus]
MESIHAHVICTQIRCANQVLEFIVHLGKKLISLHIIRVSFGSSKGSMVETLVYDHQEDLSELPAFLTAAPVTNG